MLNQLNGWNISRMIGSLTKWSRLPGRLTDRQVRWSNWALIDVLQICKVTVTIRKWWRRRHRKLQRDPTRDTTGPCAPWTSTEKPSPVKPTGWQQMALLRPVKASWGHRVKCQWLQRARGVDQIARPRRRTSPTIRTIRRNAANLLSSWSLDPMAILSGSFFSCTLFGTSWNSLLFSLLFCHWRKETGFFDSDNDSNKFHQILFCIRFLFKCFQFSSRSLAFALVNNFSFNHFLTEESRKSLWPS